MTDTITLKCPACPAEKSVARLSSDYPEAVAIVVHCDRHGSVDPDIRPKYLGADGKHITRDPQVAQ